jgi:hypothetical protein
MSVLLRDRRTCPECREPLEFEQIHGMRAIRDVDEKNWGVVEAQCRPCNEHYQVRVQILDVSTPRDRDRAKGKGPGGCPCNCHSHVVCGRCCPYREEKR